MKIAAVIVTFHPDLILLTRNLGVLRDENIEIIVIDNTQDSYIADINETKQIKFISIGKNIGIAAAQNIGISKAVNADAIIFFDQDSVITPGFVSHLCSFLNIEKPEIVAPICIDSRTNEELPSIRISKWGLPIKMFSKGALAPVPVDIVISSGTAATVKVFQVAGGLLEPLFIDLVDIEWCLRCRSLGIPIKVIPFSILPHQIGDGTIKVLNKFIHFHTYTRSYYQIRNTIWLLKIKYSPKPYILAEIIATIFNTLLFILTKSTKKDYLSALARGIYDGLSGKAAYK